MVITADRQLFSDETFFRTHHFSRVQPHSARRKWPYSLLLPFAGDQSQLGQTATRQPLRRCQRIARFPRPDPRVRFPSKLAAGAAGGGESGRRSPELLTLR